MRKGSQECMPTIFEHKSILKDTSGKLDSNRKSKMPLLPISGLEKNTISLLARRISDKIADSASPIRELINRTKRKNIKYRSICKRNKKIELKNLDDSKESESSKFQKFISNFNFKQAKLPDEIIRPHVKIPIFPKASLKSLKCYEISPDSKRRISFADMTPYSASFSTSRYINRNEEAGDET